MSSVCTAPSCVVDIGPFKGSVKYVPHKVSARVPVTWLSACMCRSMLKQQNDRDMAFHIATGSNGTSKDTLKVGCIL